MTDDSISRQAAIDFIDAGKYVNPNEPRWSDNEVVAFLQSRPSAQPTAEPVRHGKWIDMDEQSYTWKVRCSVCGHERSMMSTQGTYPNYCENCGARMDEE